MTARVPNTPIVALRRILNAYADSLRQLGLKIAHGILWRSVHPYLKVQMRTCRITGSAHAADLLPLRDGLSFRHQQSGLVPIQGNQTVAMRDHDGLPISSPPTSKHNRPRVRRLDYSPPGYGDIQSGVHLTHAGNGMRPVAEAGTHPPSDRPDQLPRALGGNTLALHSSQLFLNTARFYRQVLLPLLPDLLVFSSLPGQRLLICARLNHLIIGLPPNRHQTVQFSLLFLLLAFQQRQPLPLRFQFILLSVNTIPQNLDLIQKFLILTDDQRQQVETIEELCETLRLKYHFQITSPPHLVDVGDPLVQKGLGFLEVCLGASHLIPFHIEFLSQHIHPVPSLFQCGSGLISVCCGYFQPAPELIYLLVQIQNGLQLSLIHISEPTRLRRISYAVFCLKKKNKTLLTALTDITHTTSIKNQKIQE